MILAAACIAMTPTLLDYSISQWKTTPELRIEDAYKWLFHATLGGEHAVQDDAGPRAWLDREWGTLGMPLGHEPREVSLRPDGKIVRLNLRPYKASGGDKEMLLALFVSSARAFKADKSDFVAEWNGLGQRLRSHSLGHLTVAQWRRLDAETRPAGFPAIDHSPEYERAYHPAYRVMLSSLLVSE